MPYRVLIVDDDPVVTRLTSRALIHAGYDVVSAENGKRALEVIMEQSVDLVITDLVMPEMEGLELIRILHDSRPLLPIVAISGEFDGQFLKVALALGARAVLRKPLSMAKLLETVRQILLLRPAGAEPEDRSTGC